VEGQAGSAVAGPGRVGQHEAEQHARSVRGAGSEEREVEHPVLPRRVAV
jgi:hypothetical protein